MSNSKLLFIGTFAVFVSFGLSHAAGAETNSRPKTVSVAGSLTPPVRLAVLNAATFGNASETNATSELLTDLVLAQLGNASCFQLVEREGLRQVLGELSLNLISDASAVKRAGTLLAADWFLIGSLRAERTNAVIVKLVEAQSGIIRDLASFTFEKRSPIAAAESIAQFAINATTNGVSLRNRQFVGIGGFGDLSVNDRYPEFTRQIRENLERAYTGTRVAIVERGMIHPLFQELRMNLGGLTGTTNENSGAQPAMFLVDGYFQSYQDTEAKVSLALRVQKIGRGEQLFSFTRPMGTQLVAQIITTINDLLANDVPRVVPVTPLEEANLQLSRGKERIGPNRIVPHYILGAGLDWVHLDDQPKRHRNISEAIEAFEATLFLDPQREEAKLFLGACLVNPLIRRSDEGKNLLHEIIRSSSNQQRIAAAKSCLEDVFPPPAPTPLPRAEQLRLEEERWFQSCAAAAAASREGKWIPAVDLTYNRYGLFHSLLENDIVVTRKRLDTLVATIEATFPALKPYFAGSYGRWCSDFSSPNPKQVEEFRSALDWCEKNPEVLTRSWLYRDVLFPDIDWCGRISIFARVAMGAVRVEKGPASVAPKRFQTHQRFVTLSAPKLSGSLEAALVLSAGRFDCPAA